MTAISNGWVTIETPSGSGNTAVTANILSENKSRTNRRYVVLLGTTAHDATATAVIDQQAYGPFVEIDDILDSHDESIFDYVSPGVIESGANTLTVIGHSNGAYVSIEETSDKYYTNLNPDDQSRPTSFVLTDASEQDHTVALDDDLSPDYGAVDEYTFAITFDVYQNSTSAQRTISLEILVGTNVTDTITFYQNGVSQNENS